MRIRGNQTGRLNERSETEKKHEGGKTKEKREVMTRRFRQKQQGPQRTTGIGNDKGKKRGAKGRIREASNEDRSET